MFQGIARARSLIFSSAPISADGVSPGLVPLRQLYWRAVLIGVISVASGVAIQCRHATAADPALVYQPLSPQHTRVPQTALNLIHTPEVQKELGLSSDKLSAFLPKLQQIDGPWWQARIRPEEEQRRITADAEARLFAELGQIMGASAATRLRQLELQAQGVRMLARPELEAFLSLSTDQKSRLEKLFAETDALAAKVRTRAGQSDENALAALSAAKKAESEGGFKLLSMEQQKKLYSAIGPLVNTAKLERIYPLAPELIDSGTWIGSPVKLAELRGRVVLVHYYAFQCSNCQANFHIYNRWHKSLSGRGVSLIGIQTPETAAERDPDKIIAAAKKDDFQFPVLIDLESANWKAWSNTMWPTVYVIDKQGYIRFWWQGELNWQGATTDKTIEDLVARLLKE